MTDPYLSPYRDAQGEHGHGFGVTLWASPKSQKQRFAVFAEMLDLGGKTVLDAGCSRGDLAAWLVDHGIRYRRYIGVDGIEPVITYAKQRGLPDSEFHVGDLVSDPNLLATGKPEVVAISGTLNTMTDDTALAILDRAWAAASQTLIFNFLSDRTGSGAVPQQDPARRLPTMRLLDWALSQTSQVAYRQDYFPHGHDGTVVMRRER